MNNTISIYGAGLAGCEAAWQAANSGVYVNLYEMKPERFSPAHHSENFAELVCSNSMRSDSVSNAVGLLKEELRRGGSLIMEAAENTKVAAGSALAVDRDLFSAYVTEKINNHPNIKVIREEVQRADTESICVIATGPLTSDNMAEYIKNELCGQGLHFFDAVAPIIDFSSINMDIAFFASRYNKGGADYINCPMTKEQYDTFYNALTTAKEAELKDFDREVQKDLKVFEGCMPVEVMAKRGYDTLRFGPLKPVGLIDPRAGKESYAVIQLRKENAAGTMYNIVGFQTHLSFTEQKRVFSMIPGLENAEFLRYGVMHRNTYINSPELLGADYSMKNKPNVFFAGQMTGVEGYIESTGSGYVAGVNAVRKLRGLPCLIYPKTTMIGAMAAYISGDGFTGKSFAPMNANFGIIQPLSQRVKGGKALRNQALADRALNDFMEVIQNKDVVG